MSSQRKVSDLPGMISYNEAFAGPWHRFRFGLALFMGLLVRGRLEYFAPLMGQAILETNGFTSNAWKAGAGAWCMWYGKESTTPKANRAYGGQEPVAVYDGFNRYIRMVSDRLLWDERKMIPQGLDAAAYCAAVADSGWLGSNATQEAKLNYARAIHKTTRTKVHPFWLWMCDDGKGWRTNAVTVGVVVLLIVLLWLLWKLVKALRNG